MGRRERERIARIQAGLEKPFRQSVTVQEMMMRCNKCQHVVAASRANAHLTECQPLGAKCGKCGDTIMPEKFMAHFKSCAGKRVTTTALALAGIPHPPSTPPG